MSTNNSWELSCGMKQMPSQVLQSCGPQRTRYPQCCHDGTGNKGRIKSTFSIMLHYHVYIRVSSLYASPERIAEGSHMRTNLFSGGPIWRMASSGKRTWHNQFLGIRLTLFYSLTPWVAKPASRADSKPAHLLAGWVGLLLLCHWTSILGICIINCFKFSGFVFTGCILSC